MVLLRFTEASIGCSLTIWNEGSCLVESDVVMTARVGKTLGYVLHRVFAINRRGGAQAREFPVAE